MVMNTIEAEKNNNIEFNKNLPKNFIVNFSIQLKLQFFSFHRQMLTASSRFPSHY